MRALSNWQRPELLSLAVGKQRGGEEFNNVQVKVFDQHEAHVDNKLMWKMFTDIKCGVGSFLISLHAVEFK